MAFNIKNEGTHAAVRELAAKTGESMSVAVDIAVRERLQKVGREGLAARLRQISRESAKHISPEWKDKDVTELVNDLLYDERGLPK